MGRKRIEITEKDRQKVRVMAGLGLRDEDIAKIYDIAEDTLQKRFKKDLAQGHAFAIGNLARRAYDKAMAGNVTMLCFLLKTKGRFREVTYIEDSRDEKNSMEPLDFTKLDAAENETLEKLLRKATPASTTRDSKS